MSTFTPRTLETMHNLPGEECECEVTGRCMAGACEKFDGCGGKDNTRREPLFYRAADRLAAQLDEEDIAIACINRDLTREAVVYLMGMGITLEDIEHTPDLGLQLALEGYRRPNHPAAYPQNHERRKG